MKNADSVCVDTEYKREKTAMRRMLGLCPRCGSRLYGDEVNCVMCRAKNANQTAKYRQTHDVKQKTREYEKSVRLKRKNSGLCVECGKERTDERLTCCKCRNKINERKKKRVAAYRIEHISLPEQWDKSGKCVRCGRERKTGYKLCDYCYENCVKASHIARDNRNGGIK